MGRSSQSRSGVRTGLRECIPCSRNNGRRGENFYYQDERGQTECKLCENSGAVGGLSCNEITGKVINPSTVEPPLSPHCWGLYTPASNCNEAQNIYRSVAIAYGMLLFTVIVLLPFVLISGGPAAIAKVMRRDVSIAALWMSKVTTNAFDLIQIKFEEKRRRWREENLRGVFKAIRRRQKASHQRRKSLFGPAPEQRVDLDQTLSHSLHSHIGIGSDNFIALLTKTLRVERRRTLKSRRRSSARPVLNDSKAPSSMSYLQFRKFISLLVQRLAIARDLMRLRLIFKELAGGRQAITTDDLERLPGVMGASVLDSDDLQLLVDRSDREDGALDMDSFLHAMYVVVTQQKVRQLCDEKRFKDQNVRAVFSEHAQNWSGDAKACMDVRAFKAASIQLGLAWSLRIIRDIQHAAKQKQAGGPLPRHHWLLHATLETLESGIWHWGVALPMVGLALYFGGQEGAAPFSDIFVPFVLSVEVCVRFGCFRGLEKSFSQFIADNSHNAIDTLASIVDVVLVLLVVVRVPAADQFISMARLGRLVRLWPVAEAVLPLKSMRSALLRRLPGKCGETTQSIVDEGRFRVTLDDFRRFVSVSKMDEIRERPIWPFPWYRQAFLKYDQHHGTHSGAVPLSDMTELVHATGHWPSPFMLSKIKDVLMTDDNTEVIYFDDFIEAMSLVRDERIENRMLACFETDDKRAFRTQIYVAKQVVVGFCVGLLAFAGALIKLATNLYVLAQATYGADRVDAKLGSYVDFFAVVAISLRKTFPVATSCLLVVAFLLQIVFKVFLWLGSYFQFNFTEVEGGVDCTGVLSLMYFPTIIIIM